MPGSTCCDTLVWSGGVSVCDRWCPEFPSGSGALVARRVGSGGHRRPTHYESSEGHPQVSTADIRPCSAALAPAARSTPVQDHPDLLLALALASWLPAPTTHPARPGRSAGSGSRTNCLQRSSHAPIARKFARAAVRLSRPFGPPRTRSASWSSWPSSSQKQTGQIS